MKVLSIVNTVNGFKFGWFLNPHPANTFCHKKSSTYNSKTCLKLPLKNRQNKDLNDK